MCIRDRIQPGKFVLVDFVGGQRNKNSLQVCCVQKVGRNLKMMREKFMSQDTNAKMIFYKCYTTRKCESIVSFEQILTVLPISEMKEINKLSMSFQKMFLRLKNYKLLFYYIQCY